MKKNILSIFSAVLLVSSFPNFNVPYLIWIGLVPLLFLLDGKSPKAAFLWGWLTGFLFFLGTHYWLIHVTLPGMVLVSVYLGVYLGLFGLGYSFFQKFPLKHKLWLLPSLWVALEFIRDRLFSGFGWACLGHSQYEILHIIQIADITGVFGVSFLIVMINVVVHDFSRKKVVPVPTYLAIVVMIGLVLVYGHRKIAHYTALEKSNFKVAVIQPNIPQSRKWDPDSWEGTQKRILDLTQKAVRQNPALIIWPETSFPGYTWQSPERYQQIKDFVARNKIPLLFGTVTTRSANQYYNSAILLSPQGEESHRYDKMHLVPFGEFLPLRPLLNFIEYFIPIGDFSRGRESTIFPDGSAVLICFEDTVAPVVRKLVKAGAGDLINITNDGWFKDTNEPFLHLQGSVFQAVANRRNIIRAANTGISGLISPVGGLDLLADKSGKKVMVEGFKMFVPHRETGELSFYTRFGDVFAYLCFFAVGFGLIKRKILL